MPHALNKRLWSGPEEKREAGSWTVDGWRAYDTRAPGVELHEREVRSKRDANCYDESGRVSPNLFFRAAHYSAYA